jgi:hypothetical protein
MDAIFCRFRVNQPGFKKPANNEGGRHKCLARQCGGAVYSCHFAGFSDLVYSASCWRSR